MQEPIEAAGASAHTYHGQHGTTYNAIPCRHWQFFVSGRQLSFRFRANQPLANPGPTQQLHSKRRQTEVDLLENRPGIFWIMGSSATVVDHPVI